MYTPIKYKDPSKFTKRYNLSFNKNMTCHDIYNLMIATDDTEPIVYLSLDYYIGLNKLAGIDLYHGAQFIGEVGNSQEIDVSIVNENGLLAGISVKKQFGSGDLRKHDLKMPLLEMEYRSHIKDFVIHGRVNDIIQDMARMINIKKVHGEFNSVTILFEKEPVQKKSDKFKFIRDFEIRGHNYIFLKDNIKPYFELLAIKLPNLRMG